MMASTHRAKMNKKDQEHDLSFVQCSCGWTTGLIPGVDTAQNYFDKHKARARAAAKAVETRKGAEG